MGQYASVFIVPSGKAINKVTNPNKPNWITAHAIASELSIAEVERLWVRFQQLGCNKDGELTDEAIRKSEYNQDVFMRNILRKYMDGTTKKITFENFLRALKWCEQATQDEKIRAIFHMLNNGNPVNPDLMVKILERVYPNDKGEPIQRITELFFQIMDRDRKGQIEESGFLEGVKRIPPGILEQTLGFNILPDEMKERLHKNLQEFRSESAAGRGTGRAGTVPPQARLTPRRGQQVPPDMALREVSDKIWKKDWARVANKLGFFSQDIDEIQTAYPNNPQHQVYQMLKQWRERDGDEAHAQVLEKALLDCGLTDAAIIMTSY
ncbi:uncharacterized protein LOC123564227 isoform X2 [Mercenaria mercenaria]|nr:uncharacterized protein LOC123564227 isoform X2 [Mercenaria mercenaria]XP_053392831.1 uncharacterized protein LOC123564227 isoform X2 [Mercenaria mercenaria]XP_053392832.1 uncharacterized protein LOC123564227 isoform X2 [Mercenaria mercenaria]